MKIHEHQAKEIFAKYGVPVPQGRACRSLEEADAAIEEMGGACVVKAQIHAGGRGKGGGVKVAKNADEARAHARAILGMNLVTPQTGPNGQIVKRLLIEESADIASELYVGMTADRARQCPVLMASSEGGMEIEEVAAKTPDKIIKMHLEPGKDADSGLARDVAQKIGVPEPSLDEATDLIRNLCRAYWETDASLAEINPLVVTASGRLVALDGKMSFDENALLRQPEIASMRDMDEEDPAEVRASENDLSYIALDGDIGCMVNGAGLAMATMDIIKLRGGSPANFLDVGGGATREKVSAAFSLMLENPRIRAILINIFGGIMRCDIIAEGVAQAARDMQLRVPLIVRLEGTNVDQGRKILAESGLKIISADSLDDAAEKAVRAAQE